MNRRKKHFAKLRAEEIRRKPPTKAQNRNQMSTYLKNMAGYKHSQLKSKSYDKIQKLFDKEMKRVNTFVDMNSEVQKINEHVEVKKDDQEEAEMKRHIEIVKDDEVAIDDIPLATKPPVIVEYQIDKDRRMGYFKLIRADESSKRYSSMIKMLQGIDREDLETLWKLVKAKYRNTRPEEDYERVLWGDLKIQKMNIKFRGGLLGLKDFKMILRVATAQARLEIDPGKTLESRPPLEHTHMEEDHARPNPGQSHVALAGPNPEPMHEDFMVTMYPQVHESLKHPDEEHVHLENPVSSTGTLSSIKNLDNFTSMTNSLLTKSPEDEPINVNMETEVESMDLPHKIDQTVNEVIKEAVQIALQAPLRERFRDLSKDDMKEILHDRMDAFLAEKDKSRKRCQDDQDPHLPPTKESEQSKKKKHDFDASADDILIPDVEHISDLEDIGVAQLLMIKTRPDWLKPIGKSKLSKADLKGPDYKVVRAFHSNNISLQYQMEECHKLLTDQIDIVKSEGHRVVPDVSKPLPLGGPPGQVTIQPQFFFNKDLEYLVSGSKEIRSALSISKLKAANYPEFGLKELIPSLWIESECEYDVSAAYGISRRWFKRKEFYITKHNAHSDHRVVRSHMKILSVIPGSDFKNLHLRDFEDMYMLHLQGKLNHLFGSDKVNLFNAINLWIRNIIIRKRVEDLQLGIESY
ncbi:hypothetical protein Tco_0660638 [Tanacetum coccineum]